MARRLFLEAACVDAHVSGKAARHAHAGMAYLPKELLVNKDEQRGITVTDRPDGVIQLRHDEHGVNLGEYSLLSLLLHRNAMNQTELPHT